ncbi:hypothetical protein BREVUG8_30067 [Brevundimonas sp. G8]|nr:hypothetical protein BREVUG8_30067 [Brevundimonas sp. G8]
MLGDGVLRAGICQTLHISREFLRNQMDRIDGIHFGLKVRLLNPQSLYGASSAPKNPQLRSGKKVPVFNSFQIKRCIIGW